MRKKFLSFKNNVCLFAIFICTIWGAQGQLVLTLDKAMEIATESNPELRNYYMQLERSQQNLLAQRASLKSQFSLDLNPVDYRKTRSFDNRLSQWYTNETFSTSGTFRVVQPILLTDGQISLINTFGWQNNSSTVEGKDNTNKAFSNNLYLQFTQPIFTYNRQKVQLKQLEYDLENALIRYALQRLNTETQITSLFYRVYMAQNTLEINKEELVNAQQSYDIIKNKVEADLSARDELFQAELNLATSRSSVEQQMVSLEDLKDNLKQTLGLDLSEDIQVVAQLHIEPVIVDLQEAISYGLESRLELRQREIESKTLEFTMMEVKARNEFKGDISLSLGIMGDNQEFKDIYANPTQNPRVMVNFSVPIFDWGEKKARIRAQQITQKLSEYAHEDQKIDIELNIRKTWRSLDNLWNQIKIAEQNVENAQLTYDLNLIRYREGDITGMEISQFQTQLSNKKISHSQALINYKTELLNLKILSLYDFETKAALVPLKDLVSQKK